eukprot:1848913-Prymnesium_polylepis.1
MGIVHQRFGRDHDPKHGWARRARCSDAAQGAITQSATHVAGHLFSCDEQLNSDIQSLHMLRIRVRRSDSRVPPLSAGGPAHELQLVRADVRPLADRDAPAVRRVAVESPSRNPLAHADDAEPSDHVPVGRLQDKLLL